MPIYKQTTEITNIDKVWANINKDIVEVYFGDKNVFTVWAELESPLPITILAAGEDLIDYRIYGNTVQTGTPTPENPIMPSGCGERTENLFDVEEITHNGYSKNNFYGQVSSNNICAVIKRFEPNTDYCVTWEFSSTSKEGVYNQMRLYATSTLIRYLHNGVVINLTQEQIDSITNVIAYFGSYNTDGYYKNFTIVQASTAPTSYVPYGYKLPMVVTNGTTTTTTLVYIGDTQLEEDEYVSYGEQKIYKHTENLCPPQDSGAWNAGYINTTGTVSNSTSAAEIYSDYIAVSSDQTYNFKNFNSFPVGNVGRWYAVGIYDANKNFISRPASPQYGIDDNLKYQLPSNAAYVRLTFRTYDTIDNQLSFTLGDIPPTQFVPYIMSTNPPVPIPALPTIEGETIIDYNPSTTPAVEPEKMYVKYRKQGT